MIAYLTKSLLALVFVGSLVACGAADPVEDLPEASEESSEVAADIGAEESPVTEDVGEAASALSVCPCGDGWYCSGSYLKHRVTSGNYCITTQSYYCGNGCAHQACGLNDYCF